jgi:hypothetical protein
MLKITNETGLGKDTVIALEGNHPIDTPITKIEILPIEHKIYVTARLEIDMVQLDVIVEPELAKENVEKLKKWLRPLGYDIVKKGEET